MHWLNFRSLSWKFMLAPIIGAALIVFLAGALIKFAHQELDVLERLNDDEYETGVTLGEISNRLALNHTKIRHHLLTRSNDSSAHRLNAASQALLAEIGDIRDMIENDLMAAPLSKPESWAAEKSLELLESYRIAVANSLLSNIKDTMITKQLTASTTSQFNILNAALLELSRQIDERLDAKLAQQQQRMHKEINGLALLFVAAAGAMLITGIMLSRLLTRDLRSMAQSLENLLDRHNPDGHRGSVQPSVVETLRYAVERAEQSHTSLERTKEELAQSNAELRESYELVAQREAALAQVNTELAATVARQEDLIAAQMLAEEGRDAALTAAERANAAKNDFLSNMSHELRTPLNAIIGFAGMIESAAFGPIGQKYQEYAADIGTSGTHLLSLVTDVLDISRIEAGKLDINMGLVNLPDVIADCETMLRPSAHSAGIGIDVEIPSHLPMLETDAFRFRQVLINLIDNAIKYSPRDSSVIIACSEMVDGRLVVSVSDSGVGISEEDIPKALEKFGQIRKGHQEAHTGMGIGLAIARLLIEMLGAELRIESAVGQGTTVSVMFPKHRIYSPPGQDARSQ